jgi:hypothetical protein
MWLQQSSVKSRRIVSNSLQMHPVLTAVHLPQISECVKSDHWSVCNSGVVYYTMTK